MNRISLVSLAIAPSASVLAGVPEPEPVNVAPASITPVAPTLAPIAPIAPDWVAWAIVVALAFALVAVAVPALVLLSAGVVLAWASLSPKRDQPVTDLVVDLDEGRDILEDILENEQMIQPDSSRRSRAAG